MDHSTNTTAPLEALEYPYQVFLIVLYSFTACFAFISNLITIIVLVKGKRCTRDLKKFLINLSVTDLLMAIFTIPFTYTNYMLGRWIFFPFMCPIVNAAQLTTITVSIYTLVSIAIDRYFAIMHPLQKSISWFKHHRSLMVFLIWFVGSLIGASQLLVSETSVFTHYHKNYVSCGERFEPESFAGQLYTAFIFTVTFAFPMIILCVVYSAMGYRLLRHKIPGETSSTLVYNSNNNSQNNKQQQSNSLKIEQIRRIVKRNSKTSKRMSKNKKDQQRIKARITINVENSVQLITNDDDNDDKENGKHANLNKLKTGPIPQMESSCLLNSKSQQQQPTTTTSCSNVVLKKTVIQTYSDNCNNSLSNKTSTTNESQPKPSDSLSNNESNSNTLSTETNGLIKKLRRSCSLPHRRNYQNHHGQTISIHQQSLREACIRRNKVLKMLITIIGVFTLCWLPIQLFTIMIYFKPNFLNVNSKFKYYAFIGTYFFCHWISMAHAFMNPIIYSFMSKNFKDDMKTIFQSFWHHTILGERSFPSSFKNDHLNSSLHNKNNSTTAFPQQNKPNVVVAKSNVVYHWNLGDNNNTKKIQQLNNNNHHHPQQQQNENEIITRQQQQDFCCKSSSSLSLSNSNQLETNNRSREKFKKSNNCHQLKKENSINIVPLPPPHHSSFRDSEKPVLDSEQTII